MALLENSWNLESTLSEMNNISDELKKEIEFFIDSNHTRCAGKRMSFSNLIYRRNLHYIIDNIKKRNLINELHLFNKIVNK